MCFTLRLHTSAAPTQGGLTQALAPMKNQASSTNRPTRQWLYLFPFWGLPLLFVIVVGLDKLKLLPIALEQPILAAALAIFLSGGVPILQSESHSTLGKILLCGVYYTVSGIVIAFVGFFAGWSFLLAIGVQP